ncbi:hypothetical protein RB195_000526 [Necator americanus]|uniref:Uncharacterized protein n=1 Tax=Necator americanus TaxID=51031 RepID=A0ABR1DA64_NECAM
MLLKGVFPLLLGLFLKLEIAGAYSFENITSIAELNSFFESFFALTNSTSIQEWEAGLPKPIELAEMQELIRKLYRMNDFDKIDSSFMLNYKSLNSYVNVSIIQDRK